MSIFRYDFFSINPPLDLNCQISLLLKTILGAKKGYAYFLPIWRAGVVVVVCFFLFVYLSSNWGWWFLPFQQCRNIAQAVQTLHSSFILYSIVVLLYMCLFYPSADRGKMEFLPFVPCSRSQAVVCGSRGGEAEFAVSWKENRQIHPGQGRVPFHPLYINQSIYL